MSQTQLNAATIADFLSQNPLFFLEHEHLLLSLKLPHPRTAQVLSLAERQTLYLRRHTQQLEKQLQQLVHRARENELIQQALWRWATELLSYTGPADALSAFICDRLQVQYGLQEVQLRVWWDCSMDEPSSIDKATHHAIAQLKKPYTGSTANQQAAQWFKHHLTSMALVPLYEPTQHTCIGALALGSDVPQRFTPKMSTDFLEIMAQVIVASLSRYHAYTPTTT